MWREFASPAVDVLIANAGINRPGHLVDVTEDDYDAVLDTNVKGVFLLLKQVLPGMIDRGSGQVVVTNSVLGLKPAVNSSLYCASKFALDGLVKSCREEVRQHGIKVGQVRHASRGIERERERERERESLVELSLGRGTDSSCEREELRCGIWWHHALYPEHPGGD
jgi:NADP-dependent 3-hydroxy acid dehydrogenase YdfG